MKRYGLSNRKSHEFSVTSLPILFAWMDRKAYYRRVENSNVLICFEDNVPVCKQSFAGYHILIYADKRCKLKEIEYIYLEKYLHTVTEWIGDVYVHKRKRNGSLVIELLDGTRTKFSCPAMLVV